MNEGEIGGRTLDQAGEWSALLISGASERAIEEGARRFRIMALLLRESALYDPEATVASVAKAAGVSKRVLYHWLQRYEAGGRRPAALIDQPRGGKGRSRSILDERVLAEIKRMGLILMRNSGNHRVPTAAVCRWVIGFCEANQISKPTRDAVRRVLLSIPRSERFYAAHGPEGWMRDVAVKPPIKRALAAGELVCMDTQVLDLFVLHGDRQRRPRLQLVVDEFSGAVLGFCVGFEDTSVSAGLATRHAILPKDSSVDPLGILCGVPGRMHTDQGKNFLSKHYEMVMHELGCEIVPAVARSPWTRPVEGTFSVLVRQLIQFLPGYTGPRPTSKPLPSKRLLTIDEARSIIGNWLFAVYNQMAFDRRRINGRRISRYELHASVETVRRLPRSEDVTHLLMKRIMRRITIQGIRLFGMYLYWHEALLPFAEERATVEVRFDPADMSRILVYHRGRPLCWATDSQAEAAQATYADVRDRRRMSNERRAGVAAAVDPILETSEDGRAFLQYLAGQRQPAQAAAVGGGGNRIVPLLLPKERPASRLRSRRGPKGRGPSFQPPREAPARGRAGANGEDLYDPIEEALRQ